MFAGPRGSKRKNSHAALPFGTFRECISILFYRKDTFFSESGVILKAVPIPVILGGFQVVARDELWMSKVL